MAKIELVSYTDRIGNPLYFVRIDGRQVEGSETPDYAQSIRFYNYAVMNEGQESYEVLKSESVGVDERYVEQEALIPKKGVDAPVADENYDWHSSSAMAAEQEKVMVLKDYNESKLWKEWTDRPIWEATQSFQDFVEKKIGAEREEYERTRNSGHSGSGEEKEVKYTDMSFGAMANRMNDGEFLTFVSDCYKAKQRSKLNEFLSEFVDQFYVQGKDAQKASTHALYTAVLNMDPPF